MVNKIDRRIWVLVSIAVAVIALLLLAASLESIEMDPGQPIQFRQLAPDLVDEQVSDSSIQTIIAILRGMMLVFWVLLPGYIIYLIVSPTARKRLLRDLLAMLPILLLLYIFMQADNTQGTVFEDFRAPGDAVELGDIQGEGATVPEFNAEPSDLLVLITSIAIAVFVTLLLVAIVYSIYRSRNNERMKDQPLQKVEMEAQAAINAIEAGGDFRSVIMRCYYEMSKAVSEHRSLMRSQDMTPHEFEVLLEGHGMPREPVHQLTQLFEQVRYGALNPGRTEERVAVNSLSAIIAACRRSR